MTGARFVHEPRAARWDVMIATQAGKGVAPLAAKTDKIDAHVLAELPAVILVPEIWLPRPTIRAERGAGPLQPPSGSTIGSALKCRIHATFDELRPQRSGLRLVRGHPDARYSPALSCLTWPPRWPTSLAMIDEARRTHR